MSQFAIIETGGHQYRVEKGMKLSLEKIEGEAGQKVTFDQVLLYADGDKAQVGQPTLAGAQVEGKILAQGRDKKITIIKKIAKKRHENKRGYRQNFTEIEITVIKVGAAKTAAPKKEEKPAAPQKASKPAPKKAAAKK